MFSQRIDLMISPPIIKIGIMTDFNRVILTFVSVAKYCSAWSRLKLNTKIGLSHQHPPPTHHKLFLTV